MTVKTEKAEKAGTAEIAAMVIPVAGEAYS
jgi:hypothetical protein